MKHFLLTAASVALTLLAPFTFAAELPVTAAVAAEHSVSTGSSILMAQNHRGGDSQTPTYAKGGDRGKVLLAANSDGRYDSRVPGTAS
jgi:hypothetical protein